MPVCEKPEYIHEPTPLQCGQAVLAMLSGLSVADIVKILDNEKETTLKEMFYVLDMLGIGYKAQRVEIHNSSELPPVCILSLETPRCWHWSLYFKGAFLDPEHGVLDDFPVSNRRYYWEIIT